MPRRFHGQKFCEQVIGLVNLDHFEPIAQDLFEVFISNFGEENQLNYSVAVSNEFMHLEIGEIELHKWLRIRWIWHKIRDIKWDSVWLLYAVVGSSNCKRKNAKKIYNQLLPTDGTLKSRNSSYKSAKVAADPMSYWNPLTPFFLGLWCFFQVNLLLRITWQAVLICRWISRKSCLCGLFILEVPRDLSHRSYVVCVAVRSDRAFTCTEQKLQILVN